MTSCIDQLSYCSVCRLVISTWRACEHKNCNNNEYVSCAHYIERCDDDVKNETSTIKIVDI